MIAAALAGLLASAASAAGPRVVAIDSPAPLVVVKVMVRAGSAQDPAGSEGLARMTARLLVEGGFGDPAAPITRELLAEWTRRWGGAALPVATSFKETSVFTMTVPREGLAKFADTVLGPMFTRPLFAVAELDRLRSEALDGLRALRADNIEAAGLQALEDWLHTGTPYSHPDSGTEAGLRALDAAAARNFYRAWYRPENMVVAVSSRDPAVADTLRRALAGAGGTGRPPAAVPFAPPAAPAAPEAVVVGVPGAQSTGLHVGFPLALTRSHPDYWPLYVANLWFGSHRDALSHLYQVLREARGYNYGDYSYIEGFEDRPGNLLPPSNAPRRLQLFSVWVRPVAHQHAAHVARAVAWEVAEFARGTMTEDACAMAKKKARVRYLSLADSTDRLVAERLDDEFYGINPGTMEGYLARVDAVTCAQMNAAVRRHLGGRPLRFLLVTDAGRAAGLADALASEGPVWGKGPGDYHIDVAIKEGRAVYEVPEEKLELLRRDAVWANHRLGLARERIKVVPVDRLFVRPGLAD